MIAITQLLNRSVILRSMIPRMSSRTTTLLCLVASAIVCSSRAATAADEHPVVSAVRVGISPRIDGFLTDSVWALAVPAKNFLQRDPAEGQPASEPSEIRVLYDGEALYFGCMFFDKDPAGIVARLARRDDEEDTDLGSIRIDAFLDHQNACEFSFNPAGVRIDILLFEDGEKEDASWDPVWEVETRITQDGWSAEVRIPFGALRYPSNGVGGNEQTWGINFLRTIHRKQEETRWAFTPKSMSGAVSRFGHLVGLHDLPRPRRFELMPFGVVRQQWQPAEAKRASVSSTTGDGGLDVKVGLSNNFILDGTVNPDFAQVEADPAVLNLSTIETFYPEQRPFFIEGTQILRFNTFSGEGAGPGLFYSRRIGRALGVDAVELNDQESIISVPQSATILGAAKITGKTSDGTSLGVLEAVTKREYAVIDSAGLRRERVVAPLSHFNVIRVREDVLEGSSVGLIATSVLRENLLPALTGGGEWNLFFDDRAYRCKGFLALSHTNGSQGERLSGSAGNVEYRRVAGVHWLWSASADFTSKHYDINDVGFFRRPNDYGTFFSLTYKEDVPAAFARNYNIDVNFHERENFDRAQLYRDVGLTGDLQTTGYWELEGALTLSFGKHDDRETRGNGLYRKPTSGSASLGLVTDARQRVIGGVTQLFGWDAHGKQRWETGVQARLRLAPWTTWDVTCLFDHVRGQEAWFANLDEPDGIRSLFGDRATDEFSATLRGSVAFTRDLTMQVYTQVFAAKGHITSFRQLITESAFAPVVYTDNPDFNEHAFTLNLVFRWEYLPGSTCFLVLSQTRNSDSANYFTTLGQDLKDLFALAPENNLQCKVSFWWNL
jgi:hypothetical protein